MAFARVKMVELYPGTGERQFLVDLSSSDAAALRGEQGPAGPRGVVGPRGPAGQDGSDAEIGDVPSWRVLGRLSPETGALEFLTGDELLGFLRRGFGILDNDDEGLTDNDGRPLYEPGEVFQNPFAGSRVFRTVAEMLACAAPWDVDRAETIEDGGMFGGGGSWVMIAGAHGLTPDGEAILPDDSGYGVFRRVPASGFALRPYSHEQISASHEWVINHGSGRYASSVFIMDDFGVEMRARVVQPDADQVVVYHDSPKSGTALLII